jgi:hypothetical protein
MNNFLYFNFTKSSIHLIRSFKLDIIEIELDFDIYDDILKYDEI